MSSIKRHLPHFGNNSNHPQKQLLADDFLVSCSTTNDRSLHPSGSSKPTMPSRAYTSKKSTASSDSRSLPSNAPPQINDAACLRQSIDECLNICSSYIQALNTVCSTGTLLAQSLTEVFSRDLSATQSNACENNYSLPKSKKSFLGLKSTTGSQVQDVTKESDVLPISDFDQVYYDMAEQFLRVFEMLSVSTAGVSANLKTETLMSLQEVMNCLDASETIPTDSKRGSDRNINLDKSIQAAKACLLSYIELQTQYSYASWKSLNHLSKALQMDCNMSDIVTNIRQHYNFDSVAKQHSSNAIPATSGLTACSQQKDLEKTDRKEKSGPDLSKAMELLSLNPTSKKGKSRRNLKHLKITSKQSDDGTLERKNQPQGNEPHSEVILDQFLSKNQTSTWPGKTNTSPVTEDQNKSSKTLSADAWSLWTSKTPSFATGATNPWIGQSSRNNPNDPSTAWDLFLPRGVLSTSEESPSAGSTSSNNTSMGTLSSNSSSYGGSSFDPFNHITHAKTNMLYNNNDGELVNCGIARDSVDYRGTSILNGSFGNYLDTCRSSTSTTTYSSVNPITKSSFDSQGINLNTATVNDLISLLGDNTSSVFPVVPSPQSTPTLKSGSHDLSSPFVQSAVPSDIRTAKTSTWPLKQTQSLTSGASTSSGQGLANWPNSLVFDGLSQPFSSDVNYALGGNDSSKWSFQESSKMVIGNHATSHFTPIRNQQNFLPQQQTSRNVGQSSFSLLESNNNNACPPRNKNF